MNVESFRDYCLGKPAATEGTPFGPEDIVFKVEGKCLPSGPRRGAAGARI